MFSHFCSEGKACVTWLPPDIIATLHQKSSDLHEKVSLSNVEKKKEKGNYQFYFSWFSSCILGEGKKKGKVEEEKLPFFSTVTLFMK